MEQRIFRYHMTPRSLKRIGSILWSENLAFTFDTRKELLSSKKMESDSHCKNVLQRSVNIHFWNSGNISARIHTPRIPHLRTAFSLSLVLLKYSKPTPASFISLWATESRTERELFNLFLSSNLFKILYGDTAAYHFIACTPFKFCEYHVILYT